jgi:hypothetical protein
MNANRPYTRLGASAVLALMLVAALPTTAIAEVEAAFGGTAGEDNRLTWAGWVSWLGEPREQARWHWRPELTGAVVGARTTDGTRRGSVPVAGAGLRAGFGGFFVGGSLALALADHRTPELSTRRQFISTVGWRHERVAVVYRHISNGSTGGPNGGEDLLAVALYFR